MVRSPEVLLWFLLLFRSSKSPFVCSVQTHKDRLPLRPAQLGCSCYIVGFGVAATQVFRLRCSCTQSHTSPPVTGLRALIGQPGCPHPLLEVSPWSGPIQKDFMAQEFIRELAMATNGRPAARLLEVSARGNAVQGASTVGSHRVINGAWNCHLVHHRFPPDFCRL